MKDRLWRIGRATFDAADAQLTIGDVSQEIDRNSASVLLRLLQAGGASVPKEELIAAGWGDRAVSENSLAKAIARLRAALGEDGRRIEAVYGTGYRLLVDGAPPPPPAPAQGRRRWIWGSLFLIGLLGAALYAIFVPREEALRIAEPADTVGRILWVDDHPENNRQEVHVFESRRIAVYSVTSTRDALDLLAMYDYDAVISDMGRGGRPLAGIDLVREMRARRDYTPFYLYTIKPSQAQRDLLATAGGQGVAVTPEGLYAFLLPGFEARTGR